MLNEKAYWRNCCDQRSAVSLQHLPSKLTSLPSNQGSLDKLEWERISYFARGYTNPLTRLSPPLPPLKMKKTIDSSLCGNPTPFTTRMLVSLKMKSCKILSLFSDHYSPNQVNQAICILLLWESGEGWKMSLSQIGLDAICLHTCCLGHWFTLHWLCNFIYWVQKSATSLRRRIL